MGKKNMVGGSRSLQMYTSLDVIHRWWSVKTTRQQKTYCASDHIHMLKVVWQGFK